MEVSKWGNIATKNMVMIPTSNINSTLGDNCILKILYTHLIVLIILLYLTRPYFVEYQKNEMGVNQIDPLRVLLVASLITGLTYVMPLIDFNNFENSF